MWGEFEDEEQEQKQEQHKKEPCIESTTPKEDDNDDVYALPLRDRVVHFMAASNIEVKSQQKYEPDLTYEERKEIIEKLLNEKPGQFLYR